MYQIPISSGQWFWIRNHLASQMLFCQRNFVSKTLGSEIWLTKVLEPKFRFQNFWKRNFGYKTFGNEISVPKLLSTKFRFQNFCQRYFVAKKAYGCYNGVFQGFFTIKRPFSCPFWLYCIVRHAMLNFPIC